LAALVVAGVLFFGSKQPAPEAVATTSDAPDSSTPLPSPLPPKIKAQAPDTNQPALVIATPSPEELEEQNQAKVDYEQSRIAELNDLAASEDPGSLRDILLELDNSDPVIRKAAVDAAVQFKSPDAIPALKDAFDQVTDFDEKVHLKEAIDFLTLTIPAETANTNPQ
jgi:hypothetical protein